MIRTLTSDPPETLRSNARECLVCHEEFDLDDERNFFSWINMPDGDEQVLCSNCKLGCNECGGPVAAYDYSGDLAFDDGAIEVTENGSTHYLCAGCAKGDD